MKTDVAQVADSIGSRATSPLIVCECTEATPRDNAAWLFVFHENKRRRLKRLWAGVLNRPEIDEITYFLRRAHTVWHAAMDTYHFPPSKRFRLVWTQLPAPCRMYTRRGLKCEVERSRARVCGFWRTRDLVLSGVERVEGWFTWSRSGIRLKLERSESADMELIRLGHPGEWLGYHDGIDLMVDTGWLEFLVPRVAEVLDVGWSIVDYTESPPAVQRGERPADAPVSDR